MTLMCPWSEGRVFIWEWNIRGLILFSSHSLHQFQNPSLYTAQWKTISLMCLWCRGRMFLWGEIIWSSSPLFSLISVTESYRSAMLYGSNGRVDMSDPKKLASLSPHPLSTSNSIPSVTEKPQQIRKPQSILLIYRQK